MVEPKLTEKEKRARSGTTSGLAARAARDMHGCRRICWKQVRVPPSVLVTVSCPQHRRLPGYLTLQRLEF